MIMHKIETENDTNPFLQGWPVNTLTSAISFSLLFRELNAEHKKKILDISIEKSYDKCQTIFVEGDESNGFYLVIDGQVKIFKMSSDGKEKILHIFGFGEPFGEVAMFSGTRFPASAETTMEGRMAFFPKVTFIQLIKDHPSLAMSMMAVLSTRLKQFTAQIEELTLKDVPSRLAGYLLYLQEEQKSTTRVSLSITKGQLASLLGTIPETLSRMMAKMSGQNLINVQGRDILILNQNGLEELSACGRLGSSPEH